MFFGFEGRVFCPPFKKILERGLLVTQALLQGNAGHSVQKSELRQLFNLSQFSICARIIDLDLCLMVDICPITENVVVNKTHTAKRPSQ